jgi:hypothetical protein
MQFFKVAETMVQATLPPRLFAVLHQLRNFSQIAAVSRSESGFALRMQSAAAAAWPQAAAFAVIGSRQEMCATAIGS